jgi:hypothetical protein
MICPGTFSVVVDLDAVPPVQGTGACSHSRYPVFDSSQTATISGEILPSGELVGSVRHKFNAYSTRTYTATGTFDGGLSFSAAGTMRPASASAVDWVVEVSGTP